MNPVPKLKNPIREELIQLRIKSFMAHQIYRVANKLLCMGYETPTLYHFAIRRDMTHEEARPYLLRLCEEFHAPALEDPEILARERDRLAHLVACGKMTATEAAFKFASESSGAGSCELRFEALLLEDLAERCDHRHPHYVQELIPWCEEQIELYWREHAPLPEFEI